MALEGSFNTNAYNKRRSVQFSWERTGYSVEDNYSDIHWKLKGGTVSSGSPSWYMLHPCYLGITYKSEADGQIYYHEIYSNDNVNIQLSYDKLIVEGDIRIYHEADGKANFSVAVSAGIYVSSINVKGNKEFSLDSIPRASVCPNASGTIGTAIIAYVSGASPSFRHTLLYTFGNLSGTIPVNSSWIIPTSFYSQIPNAKNGVGTLILITYNEDGNEIGRSSGQLFVYCEDAACIPFGEGTIVDTNSTTINLTGDSSKIIKGISNALISYRAFPKNEATIKSIVINSLSVPVNAADKFCDLAILNAQSAHYVMRIEDSRGYVSEVIIGNVNNLIDYAALSAVFEVKRDSPTGNKVFLSLNGKIFNNNFGTELNSLRIKWRVKSIGKEYSEYQDINYTTESSIFDVKVEIENPLSSDKTWNYLEQYQFELTISDKVSSNSLSFTLKKGKPNHNWYEKDGVNYFNVNGRLYIEQKDIFDVQYPVDSIKIFYDDLDHSNYLGFTWVRTLKDRIPRGYIGDSGTHKIGERGGSAYLQRHSHPFTATTSKISLTGTLGEVFSGSNDTNSGIVKDSTVGSYRQYTVYSQATNMWKTFNFDASHEHSISGTTSETGSNEDNWNPYEIVSFWRRIK